MATGKPTRAAVKKALLERLKQMNACDAVNKDLLEQYLDARDRLMQLEDAYIDRWNEYDEAETNKIATEIANMAKIMNAMGLNETTKRREEIEAEIREQLQAKGLGGPVFEDRISQFLALWDAFQEANKSLRERGRSYFTTSSSGKLYEKDNTASRDIVTFAKAMQDALDNLEITVKGYTNPDDDEL